MSKLYVCDECGAIQDKDMLKSAIFVLCPDPHYEEEELVCFRCGCGVYEVAECNLCGELESVHDMRDGLCQLCNIKKEKEEEE